MIIAILRTILNDYDYFIDKNPVIVKTPKEGLNINGLAEGNRGTTNGPKDTTTLVLNAFASSSSNS